MPKKYVRRVRKIVRGSKRMRRRTGGVRRKNRSTPNLIVAKFPNKMPFPRKYMCKLTYSDIVPIVSGTSRAVDNVFSHNSVFDPDATGVGHQPRYFDQLSALYNQYRVVGCKIRARFMPQDALTPGQTHYLSIIPNNDNAALTGSTYLNISERPYSTTTVNNIYGRRSQLTQYKTTSQIFGVASSVVRNEDDYRSGVSGNPSARSYWHVVVGTLDEGSNTVAGRLVVDITYYVQFEVPIVPLAS